MSRFRFLRAVPTLRMALVLLAALAFTPSAAASGWRKPAPPQGSPAAIAADHRKLVAEGDRYMSDARKAGKDAGMVARGTSATDTLARHALAAYDRALELIADPDVYYRAFVATTYMSDASLERWRLVVRYFDGLRASAPRDPRETFMLPELCTALSKLGGAGGADADAYFNRGVAEYDVFRQRVDDTDPRYANMLSTYSTNAAELLMALGPDRLDEAITYYETGIQYDSYESLGYYGAAVAYDRDGQWGKARELLLKALERDPVGRPDADKRGVHTMGRLSDQGVYFVPEGDVEYYYALGYHVQGYRQEALRHYKRFLAEVPQTRFAARAKEHIAELEAELGLGGGGGKGGKP
jgi:tetratricopeptide (TPR) repeat protein